MEKEIQTPKILKNKIFLYLTEFFSGMSLMAIELGAQRLLAPYFSSSQIVWTIVIGSIMIAMALGNIYGGKKADKDPNPTKLYARLIIAASWIALIPWLGKYVIAGISAILIFTVSSGYLVIAATASCIVLFIFPLFLLGTTTPCLVKYSTRTLDESGRVVGMLGACNTIGSIIGTFLPTFVTIPLIGTNITFLVFAFILLALSIAYFISIKVFQVKMAFSLVIFTLASIFGYSSNFAFWEKDIMYEGESMYNYLRVSENYDQVELSTNVLFGVQSVYNKDKKLSYGQYYNYDLAAPLMTNYKDKDNVEVLILGMGSGTYATQLDRYYNNMHITGVEIDGKITDLAYQYFNLSSDYDIYTYDGRAFLNIDKNKYDIIMVDAYQDITIPFQMSSIEFFNLVKSHLTEDGVLVVNLNMRSNDEGNINFYLCDTICACFDYAYTIDVGQTNRELFASNNQGFMDDYLANLDELDDIVLKTFLNNTITYNIEKYEPGNLIFTDDKAPVELLGIKVIDNIIDESVDFYKNIYKERGLKGLLELLS